MKCCSSKWCGTKTISDVDKESNFSECYSMSCHNSQTYSFALVLIKKFSCRVIYVRKGRSVNTVEKVHMYRKTKFN